MKKEKNIYATTLLLLIFVGLCGQAEAQVERSGILTSRITVKFSNVSVRCAITTLARDRQIPIGLEIAPSDSDDKVINIEARDEPLPDVLNTIVQQAPAYTWNEREGVVDFSPAGEHNLFISGLLGKRIDHFDLGAGNDGYELLDKIYQLPEVKSEMLSAGMRRDWLSDSPSGSDYPLLKSDISISDADLKTVLNKIILETRFKVWIITVTGKSANTLSIAL
jgi:hypothetical protein